MAPTSYKRNVLPGTFDNNTFYVTLNNGTGAQYVADSSGNISAVGNVATISSIVDNKLTSYATLQQVATIAARNTAASTTNTNTMFLVNDATADATVTMGAALYFFNKVANVHTKVAEYESLDFVANMSQLINWTQGECYEPLVITRNINNLVTSATVKWTDGSAGVLTMTNLNSTFNTFDGYTITHINFNKTITQAAVTRNATGNVTVKPVLVVS